MIGGDLHLPRVPASSGVSCGNQPDCTATSILQTWVEYSTGGEQRTIYSMISGNIVPSCEVLTAATRPHIADAPDGFSQVIPTGVNLSVNEGPEGLFRGYR